MLALLAGFIVAPHTHRHPADGVAHHDHPQRGAVKHAHLTSHAPGQAHHAPEPGDQHGVGTAEGPGQPHAVSAAGEFVFRAPPGPASPSRAVLAEVASVIPLIAISIAYEVFQPPAHAPPEGRSCRSRAPPIAPPAA
jgi:hypothetical protein